MPGARDVRDAETVAAGGLARRELLARRLGYPRDMAGKPATSRGSGADPPHAPDASEATRAPGGSAAATQERLGPIVLTRMVKDDGRALLVYARASAQA